MLCGPHDHDRPTAHTRLVRLSSSPIGWSAFCRMVARHPGPVRWAWAVGRDRSGPWVLSHVAIRAPEAAEPVLHRYPDAVLGVEALTPAAAARRLRRGLVVPKRVVGVRLGFAPYDQAYVDTLSSNDDLDVLASAPWPRLVWALNLDSQSIPDAGPLHARHPPFFPSLRAGAADVVFQRPLPPPHRARLRTGVLVLARNDGRITGVTTDDGVVTVGLELDTPDSGFCARIGGPTRMQPPGRRVTSSCPRRRT